MLRLIVLCFVVVTASAVVRKIPDYIHICKRNDPQVSKCIRESVEILRPRLRVGIPELNVPSLDPLHINEIEILRGDPPRNFKATLQNISAYGLGDFKINKLKVNLDKRAIRVGVQFPIIKAVGDYDLDLKLLSVPLKGHGKFHADIVNAEGQGILKAEIKNVDDHRELDFTSFNFVLRIQDYNIELDNLFDGDQTLSRAANEVLHSNKAEFIEAAMPFIQERASSVILQAANRITSGIDYDQIFPEK